MEETGQQMPHATLDPELALLGLLHGQRHQGLAMPLPDLAAAPELLCEVRMPSWCPRARRAGQ